MDETGPDGMANMVGDMMPQMMEKIGHEAIESMMLNMMPGMETNAFLRWT